MTAAVGRRQLEVQLGHDVRAFHLSPLGRRSEDRAHEKLPAIDQPGTAPRIWSRGAGCLELVPESLDDA